MKELFHVYKEPSGSFFCLLRRADLANRIAGIIMEISGDTTKLSTADCPHKFEEFLRNLHPGNLNLRGCRFNG